MKVKKLIFFVAGVFIASLVAGAALAGNGIPREYNGKRFMLNVIAFDNCPAGDFQDSNRHMIAVEADFTPEGCEGDLSCNQGGKPSEEIDKRNTIQLMPAADFNSIEVFDGNACDDREGALLYLPIPELSSICDDPTSADCVENFTDDDVLRYKVFVRLVGKYGNPKAGKVNTGIGVTSCANVEWIEEVLDGDDIIHNDIVCSTENVIEYRQKGKPKFDDVSKELLTLCLDTDYDEPDGICDQRFGLFDTALYEYFWQWNTQGKAHAQLVFVPIP